MFSLDANALKRTEVVQYLQQDLDSEHAREPVVEVRELLVPLALRLDGVLARERHGRHHYHLQQQALLAFASLRVPTIPKKNSG